MDTYRKQKVNRDSHGCASLGFVSCRAQWSSPARLVESGGGQELWILRGSPEVLACQTAFYSSLAGDRQPSRVASSNTYRELPFTGVHEDVSGRSTHPVPVHSRSGPLCCGSVHCGTLALNPLFGQSFAR